MPKIGKEPDAGRHDNVKHSAPIHEASLGEEFFAKFAGSESLSRRDSWAPLWLEEVRRDLF